MLYALMVLLADDVPKGPVDPTPLWYQFLLPAVLMGLFVFLIILPAQRREKKQRETIFSALKKNDEVITSAGIIGVVVSIKDNADEVTLKIDDNNARLRVLKSSIVRIVNKSES